MDEQQAVRRAVALSRAVLGTTSPNPPVGAIVLDSSGEVVGEGATQPPGGAHAEVVALAEAGVLARGSTVVVTLEPCAHSGRTSPCTTALLEAGVRRVVVACAEPTSLAGGGAKVLCAAGVDVVTGVLEDEVARGPLEAWLGAQRLGRPFVTWKYAATLDGRSAAADGTSKWITSQQARADVAQLRSEVDAVVAGIGTVLADDPGLTVRIDGRATGRQPLRVVLDSDGRTPPGARVLDDSAESLVVTSALAPRHDPAAVLALLGERGVVSVLLEGGPTVAASFVAAGLVDRIVGYVAPALLGDGPSALASIGAGTITDAVRLRLDEVSRVGDDVRLVLRRG